MHRQLRHLARPQRRVLCLHPKLRRPSLRIPCRGFYQCNAISRFPIPLRRFEVERHHPRPRTAAVPFGYNHRRRQLGAVPGPHIAQAVQPSLYCEELLSMHGDLW